MRSLLTLYFPWRNEDEEVSRYESEQVCIANKEIENYRILFEKLKKDELDEVIQYIQEENEHLQEEENSWILNQVIDNEFWALAMPVFDENFNILNLPDENDGGPNDGNSDDVRVIRLPAIVNREILTKSVRSLNLKQGKYSEFISGGASVGKSRLIKTIPRSNTSI